jgi:hypothetical protein
VYRLGSDRPKLLTPCCCIRGRLPCEELVVCRSEDCALLSLVHVLRKCGEVNRSCELQHRTRYGWLPEDPLARCLLAGGATVRGIAGRRCGSQRSVYLHARWAEARWRHARTSTLPLVRATPTHDHVPSMSVNNGSTKVGEPAPRPTIPPPHFRGTQLPLVPPAVDLAGHR